MSDIFALPYRAVAGTRIGGVPPSVQYLRCKEADKCHKCFSKQLAKLARINMNAAAGTVCVCLVGVAPYRERGACLRVLSIVDRTVKSKIK